MRDGLSGQAYDVVRQRIVRGDLKLGQVISRRTLAGEMGMSFLPVAEALLRLEVEGLLESRPRAGTRVRIPTEQDVDGHYVIREALEMQAAKLFVENAHPREKAELCRLANRLDRLTPTTDRERRHYLTAHKTLHSKIAEYGGCRALCDAIEQTHALGSTWMCVGRSGHVLRRHQTLVNSLTSGDATIAVEAMREHVYAGRSDAFKRLAPYFKLKKASGNRYLRSTDQSIAGEE